MLAITDMYFRRRGGYKMRTDVIYVNIRVPSLRDDCSGPVVDGGDDTGLTTGDGRHSAENGTRDPSDKGGGGFPKPEMRTWKE